MPEFQDPIITEEYLEEIRSYRPIDDTFMRNVFRDSPEITESVLRILMDKPDLEVISSETQVDLKRITGSRGLCLDVVATDSTGKKYDIEVQKESDGAGPHRGRYHSSAMDVENSFKGMDFDELPDTYVIFITERDYYGRNRSIYRVRRTVEDDNSLYGDGSNILYVNGQYRDDTDIGKLMHDFCCWNPDDMLIPMLAKRTRYLKTNEKEVKRMCEQMKRVEDRGIAKGVSIGEYNKAKEMAIELYKINRPLDEIAKVAKVSIELVKQWIEENK